MKIVLGIPVVHVVPGQAFSPLMALAATLGRRGEVIIPEVLNMFPYDNARKLVMDTAENFDADYVMFVDSDMVPPANAFDLMLQGLQGDVRMVTGHTYQRGYPFNLTWFKVVAGTCLAVTAPADTGLHEVDATGLACTLIDFKWVLKNVKKPYFAMRTNDGKKCSEDIFFSCAMQEAGGKILGDSRVRCGHLGGCINVCDSTREILIESYRRENANASIR
jgi:hypothetical protein